MKKCTKIVNYNQNCNPEKIPACCQIGYKMTQMPPKLRSSIERTEKSQTAFVKLPQMLAHAKLHPTHLSLISAKLPGSKKTWRSVFRGVPRLPKVMLNYVPKGFIKAGTRISRFIKCKIITYYPVKHFQQKVVQVCTETRNTFPRNQATRIMDYLAPRCSSTYFFHLRKFFFGFF